MQEIGVEAGVGERVLVNYKMSQILASFAQTASGSGGDTIGTDGGPGPSGGAGPPGGNDTAANAAILQALLAAAGVNLGGGQVITIDALTALEIALIASGLSSAVNISALAAALPGLQASLPCFARGYSYVLLLLSPCSTCKWT